MIKINWTKSQKERDKREREKERKKIFYGIRFILFSCLTAIILYLFVWLGLALDTTL